MKKMIVFSILLLLATTVSVHAVIRCVPDQYLRIQNAIHDSSDGDVVIVSPGRYYETINFSGRNITLTSTNPNDPCVVSSTIIDADSDGSVVIFENGETSQAVLTGFTITGGYGTMDNTVSAELRILWGAGIFCYQASPTITCNVIADNRGPVEIVGQNMEDWILSYGVGIGCIQSGAVITRNIIRDNSGYVGSGILIYFGDATISNNLIYDNSAYVGGGVVMVEGHLTNNTIVGNDASLAGMPLMAGNVYAIFDPTINDCQISNNIICNAKSGGGIYWEGPYQEGSLTFNNVWNNSPGNYSTVDPETYQPIYGGQFDKTGVLGNISEDPVFINSQAKDFHLQADSPCISAGDPNFIAAPSETDIDGEPRVFAWIVDIGADEYIGYTKPIAYAGPDQHVLKSQHITLDGTGSCFPDPCGVTIFEWMQVEGPTVTLSDPFNAKPTFTADIEGQYRFELVVSNNKDSSKPDEVLVLVGNQAPVANAGSNSIYQVPARVELDGTGSYDPDTIDELTYTWTQLAGPEVVLTNADTAKPYFDCIVDALYVFELVVNDGFVDSDSSIVNVVTVTVTMNQESLNVSYSTSDNFHYPDVSGTKVVYGVGPACDYTWDIKCKDLETGKVNSFSGGGIDTQPKIDGDMVVWFGGPYFESPWGHEPSNTSVFVRNIATGAQKILRGYTWSESYSHPAVSYNKVVWLEHLNLDPNPPGNSANRWWNTPYNICGADISDFDNPVYFTIAEDVGSRDPYPCLTYSMDFDDVIGISGDIVVWEGDGDIYGADTSDINDIKVFTICSNPAHQYDPAISGNLVVWTDERNDGGDIYGADIFDTQDIQELVIVRAPGSQLQPAVDGSLIVYIEGSAQGGLISVCYLTSQYGVLSIALDGLNYGTIPAVDGQTVVWQDLDGRAGGLSLRFGYSVPEGPVQNLTTGKYYDSIQHAINAGQEGEHIVVNEGVYYESIDFCGKNLIVSSVDPNNSAVVMATVIEGGSQAVRFSRGEDANCVLSGFTITGADIGVYCTASSPTITKCRIVGNNGPGIKLLDESNLTVRNCIIAANTGAGIEMWADKSGRFILYNYATVTNCTIAGNLQQGICGSNPTITNSILYYNGSDCNNVQIEGMFPAVFYSNVQDGWPGLGNIDADPCFVSPGYWVQGDPDAMWMGGDYHLASQGWSWKTQRNIWTWDDVTSPCVDTGNPGSPLGQELMSVAEDPDNYWGQNTRINMGAYGGTAEASMPPHDWVCLADITNDGIVDFQDYCSQSGGWLESAENPPGDLNRNGLVEFADLALFADDWLGLAYFDQ